MKEERLAVLGMLEKGIITVDEAERLLNILQNQNTKDRINKEEVASAINGALNKAACVLGNLVHTVGEKASDAADAAEPIIKKAAATVADKISSVAEDVKQYSEKSKECDKDKNTEYDYKKADINEQKSDCPKYDSNDDENSYYEKNIDMDYMDIMQYMPGYSVEQEKKTFAERAVCDRTTPCCGKDEEECSNVKPCCDGENFCTKEQTCCGKDESECERMTPCCWDKNNEQTNDEQNGGGNEKND